MSEPLAFPDATKPIGRPLKEIDIEVVERAAAIGCTIEEVAGLCGVGRTTFYDRMEIDPDLKAAVDRGRENGKVTLRRLQWRKAEAGSDTMLIWLGKQMLGQRDKQEVTGANGGPIEMRDATPTEVARRVAFLLTAGLLATPANDSAAQEQSA